jgi:hypothetical protein
MRTNPRRNIRRHLEPLRAPSGRRRSQVRGPRSGRSYERSSPAGFPGGFCGLTLSLAYLQGLIPFDCNVLDFLQRLLFALAASGEAFVVAHPTTVFPSFAGFFQLGATRQSPSTELAKKALALAILAFGARHPRLFTREESRGSTT